MFPFYTNPNVTKVGIIQSLQNATHLNGKICLMKKFHESRNRWQVVVENEDLQEKVFLVKEENLRKVAIHQLLVFQFRKNDFDVLDITGAILDYVEKDNNGTLEAEMKRIDLETAHLDGDPFEEYTLKAMLETIYWGLACKSTNLENSEKQMLMLVDITKLDLMNEVLAEFLFENLEMCALRLDIFELMSRPVLTFVVNFKEARSYTWKKSETDFKHVNRWIHQRVISEGKSGCCICHEDYTGEIGYGRTCKQCFALICESCQERMAKDHGFVFPCPVCRGEFTVL